MVPLGLKRPKYGKKFTGTDGEVGALSYWNGNKDVGEGDQEIIRMLTVNV